MGEGARGEVRVNVQDKDVILKLQREITRLKLSIKQHKYGLVWMDIPEAFEDDVEDKLPILKELPDLAIKNRDGKPTHILIEGDNYHALTCLNYTHKGKIDVIYIDPPYNTGSDGFRYRDKRIINKFPDGTDVPKDSPFRHSYWLSFMRKRLELSRDLLKDNGAIFISIDDNELAQLKLLCDQIFFADNFESVFVIKVRHESRMLRQDARYQQVVEYLLMYSKTSKFNPSRIIYSKNADDDYEYTISLKRRPKCIEKIGNYQVEIYTKNDYEIKTIKDGIFKCYSIRGSLITQKGSASEFYEKYLRVRKEKDGLGTLYKVIGMGTAGDGIGYRFIQQPLKTSIKNGNYYQGRPIKPKDIVGLPHPNFFDFVNEFNNVAYDGGVGFRGGKKPITFIKKLFEISNLPKNGIVLDFFAGSGSTGHAVIDLNDIDGGKRQFILINNNEVDIDTRKMLEEKGYVPGDQRYEKEGICKKYCYPRIKNVMLGKNDEKNLGNSLKYYKTSFIGKNNILNATDEDKVELAHNAGELLAIAENTLELVKQNKYWQLFEDTNKGRCTAVYFREELDKFEEFVAMIAKLKKKTTVYVFSWGDEEFSDDFSHINDIKIKTIPLPILEIYKNIYNLGA